MNQKHEQMIQRLIDNELNEQDRAEVLKYAEQHPELWRQISLAFVEDRVWSSFVSADSNQTAAVVDEAGTGKTSTARRRPWWLQYGPQLMMTAASVLFVLTLALQLNPVDRRPGPAPSGGSMAQKPDSGLPADDLIRDGEQLVSEPYRLQMGDMELPVYDDRGRFEQELQRIQELDPAMARRFLDAGYHIQPDVHYITGALPDGRRVVMPVQRFQVIRIGQ